MKENRLYRVMNGKVIGGVAGGLAEFFGMDPTIIRIIFILLTVMGGGGLLIYIVLWIVVPERYNVYNPYSTSSPRPAAPTGTDTGVGETYEGYSAGVPPVVKTGEAGFPVEKGRKLDGGLIAGLVLILIGGFFLFERFFPRLSFGDFWPLLLVLIGAIMIIRGFPLVKKSDETEIRMDETTRTDKENTTNNDLNL
ncbi:MAG TPA: PspC domain-containing protein [Lentimicrobium sp.]|nr:PspC domain-containing protein [Lentimicrobium sp.]